MTKLKDALENIFIAKHEDNNKNVNRNNANTTYDISVTLKGEQQNYIINNSNNNNNNSNSTHNNNNHYKQDSHSSDDTTFGHTNFSMQQTKRSNSSYTTTMPSFENFRQHQQHDQNLHEHQNHQHHQFEHQHKSKFHQNMVMNEATNTITTTTAKVETATQLELSAINATNGGYSIYNRHYNDQHHKHVIQYKKQQQKQKAANQQQQQHHHQHNNLHHYHQQTIAASFVAPTLSAAFTTTATTILTAAKAAATTTATTAAEHLYSGVAVGLGAMLINDTLLLEAENGISGNGTSLLLYDDDNNDNGSDLILNVSSSSTNNTNGNITTSDEDFGELLRMATTSVVLGLLILITIIGNVFVIAAIILERNLQNVANYLVASLAVADLFVACLVMPLGAVYEIRQGWILGPELCDIWTSCDVLCCTASILHLVAIAVDRYWAVTNIDYIHSRTSKRVFLMIFFVWSAAVIVSLAPQFGWKDPDYLQRIEQQKCMVSQDVAYQVFATCCTFYVPLLVILVLYWKIYQTARKRIHRRRPRPIDVTGNNNKANSTTQKKRKRLRLRIGKFSTPHTTTTNITGQTTLGLVEGNSTNTVNTVEDTEFSSSNVDSKSRAGVESTTMFSNNPEENPTTSTSQISTVSHLVALANQQQTVSQSSSIVLEQQQQQHKAKSNKNLNQKSNSTSDVVITTIATTASTNTATKIENNKLPPTATIAKVCIVDPNDNNDINLAPSGAMNGGTQTIGIANGDAEVLEDPQLQQQLQQVHRNTDATAITTTTTTTKTTPSAAYASNATTITSISALSPQTPTTAITTQNDNCDEQLHPLAHTTRTTATATASTTTPTIAYPSSCQLTPIPKIKQSQPLSSISNPVHKVTKRKETLEAKRERKAAKTLAIITGAFVICWLPFFVMALLLPLCETCEINDGIASVFLWLGYFNSTLNPVIYTIFSPEFRQAFKRILFGGHRPVHYRSGKI